MRPRQRNRLGDPSRQRVDLRGEEPECPEGARHPCVEAHVGDERMPREPARAHDVHGRGGQHRLPLHDMADEEDDPVGTCVDPQS